MVHVMEVLTLELSVSNRFHKTSVVVVKHGEVLRFGRRLTTVKPGL